MIETDIVDSAQPRGHLSFILLSILALTGLFALFEIHDPGKLLVVASKSEAWFHHFVESSGLLGPLLCIIAYAALMLLIWVPSWPCSMFAGLCFGPILGAVCSLIACTLGAVGVFELTRSGLAPRVPRENAVFHKFEQGFRRNALEYVIALRLMPVIPFGIIHVAAGVSGVTLPTFVLGTAIGMLPCVAIYAYLGHDLQAVFADPHGLSGAVFTNPKVYVPLVGLAALALMPSAIRACLGRSKDGE